MSAEAVANHGLDPAAFARATCARHTGVGADGLILYTPDARGATMRLLNADGSPSEVSGNGLRGLGAILAEDAALPVGGVLHVRTGAGMKTLTLVSRDAASGRLVFRADMGPVEDLARARIDAAGETFDAVTLRVGNPQCVILADRLDEPRLHRIGPALQAHRGVPRRRERRARPRRGAGSRAHPDLGARRRPDRIVGHRILRVGGRGGVRRRRRPRRRGDRAGRLATGRVGRAEHGLAHRLGRGRAARPLDAADDGMRRLHEAIGAVETYSPAEERFNRRRRTAGLFLAPATLLLVLLLPMSGLSDAGHRLAAVMAAVVVLWVSEALPMAVTALLGPALAVVFHVATARRALASFADPIIFLFIGSFVLAEAMFVHGLDRRIAFTTLSSTLVGSSAVRMLVAYGGVATLISMWISNTATTAMLFPIGLSIVGHVGLRGTASPDALRRFAISMMLVTSFAASVGGMATPVGTPPNLIGLGLIARLGGEPVSFLAWMRLGVPLVLVMTALLLGWFAWWGARGLRIEAEGLALVRAERARLGPWTRGQRNVVVAFAVAVFLWVAPGLAAIVGQDGSRAMQAFATSVPEASPRSSAPCCCSCCRSTGGNGSSR